MKTKRILSLLLVAALALTTIMAGCGDKTPASSAPVSSAAADSSTPESSAPASSAVSSEVAEDGDFDTEAYTADCQEIYTAELGEFYDMYQVALEEVLDNDRRQALMALAEAKFLESATFLPTTASGGQFRMGRVAPYTFGYTPWSGSEGSNYEKALVTKDFVTTEDWEAMKAYWDEHKGDGTYYEWAKSYLAEKGYELKDSFAVAYSSDPQTWDPMQTSRSADGQFSAQTWDPLLYYNAEGTQVPCLAESYTVSDDKLTYTFKIRSGLKWVDSQGRELADFTADAWVAGMQHVLDAPDGLSALLSGRIKNAAAYLAGEITDFAEVGVKAVDDTTLEITLEQPLPYFLTMLSYSCFAPLCREYYESLGGTFGADYTPGTYGQDPDSIAYCGPYVVSNFTKQNSTVYTANEAYWDAANTTVKTFTYVYNDGSDTTKYYTDLVAGTTDLNNLNTSNQKTAKEDGNFDKYAHVTATGGTTYGNWFNINRVAFANVNDPNAVVSPQTEEDRARTKAAMQNVHFRRALAFALDRTTYNAQTAGDEAATFNLRNGYTPYNFATLEKDVTVEVNGTETTFPAGTVYGAIVQAQIDADGVKMTVYDAEKKSGDQFDGWYNVENARAELATAVEELAAEGVTIDADNPILIDLPVATSDEVYNNRANFLKSCTNDALEGMVQVDIVEAVDRDEWYYAGYNTDFGYEANYDIYDVSGWGPDYGDASTFLDTLLPDYDGYMAKLIGLF